MRTVFLMLVFLNLAAGNSLAAGVVSTPVEAPSMAVGDWWAFKNHPTGAVTLSVAEVSQGGFTIMNKGKPSTYTPGFNKVTGYYPTTGEAVTYAPHNANFSWPMYPGKTWSEQVTSETATKRVTYNVTAKVVAWEQIDVVTNGESRKMATLKIEYYHGSVASTCWYSPDMKNVAKCVSPFPGQTFDVIGFGNKPPD